MIDCYKVVLEIQSHSIIPIHNITGPGFIQLTKTQWELTAFLPVYFSLIIYKANDPEDLAQPSART